MVEPKQAARAPRRPAAVGGVLDQIEQALTWASTRVGPGRWSVPMRFSQLQVQRHRLLGHRRTQPLHSAFYAANAASATDRPRQPGTEAASASSAPAWLPDMPSPPPTG